MIIKFSDKFDSIFYAVLLSNLTGNFLISKNDNLGLFTDEEFIDIDKLNWRQILEEHDRRFGVIKWLDYNNVQFHKFRKMLDLELAKTQINKDQRVIGLIKQAIKFGLPQDKSDLVLHKASSFLKDIGHKEKLKKLEKKMNPFLIFDKKSI